MGSSVPLRSLDGREACDHRARQPTRGDRPDSWEWDVYAAVQSAGLEHRGGELRVSSPNAVTTIDPVRRVRSADLPRDQRRSRRVSEGRGDRGGPDRSRPRRCDPAPTDGGKTYTFQVRSGIHYSNGTLVQPDDFKRAVERLFEVQGNRDNDFERVVGADRCVRGKPCDLGSGIVTDRGARTVTFHLTAPDPDFLAKLALPDAFAVPAGTPARDVGTHPIPATGPYRIAFFGKKTKTIRLVRNRFFREWSADAQPQGYPDSISFSWRLNSDNREHRSRGAAKPSGSAACRRAGSCRHCVGGRLSVIAEERHRPALGPLPGPAPPEHEARDRLLLLEYARRPVHRRARAPRREHRLSTGRPLDASLGRSDAPTCRYLPPGIPRLPAHLPVRSGRGGGTRGCTTPREELRHRRRPRDGLGLRVERGPRAFMVSLPHSLGYRATLKVVNGSFDAYYAQVADSRVGAQTGYIAYRGPCRPPFFFLPYFVSCAAFVPASPAQTNLSEFCDPSIDAQMAHASAVQAQDPPAATVLWQRVESALALQAPVRADLQRSKRRLRLQAGRELPVQPDLGRIAQPALGEVDAVSTLVPRSFSKGTRRTRFSGYRAGVPSSTVAAAAALLARS